MLNPLSWQDKPALIEHLFPVQKISAESFKEQMAGAGKTLTALGSYWKGRKPLILNKACILGTLLPVSDDLLKDLEIFEMLMGMDEESLRFRLEIKNDKKSEFYLTQNDVEYVGKDATYNEWVRAICRPEECGDELFSHIWAKVNAHLGTSASSFPELVEQMGIARFGHRPRVADVFSGSGQIPFEAARLGCDVYASDLNPIACMLTWGGFNIVGASPEKRLEIDNAQKELAKKVQAEIDALGVETDGKGWRAKVFLYCVEVLCPESGWLVPLIPCFIISQPRTGAKNNVVVKLEPIPSEKRYDIKVLEWVNESELPNYKNGTVQNGDVVHSPDGITTYRVSINAIRGDYKEGKENKNRLRLWEKSDFIPRADDIFQERLYCVQWMKKKPDSKKFDYEFRAANADDLKREKKVIDFVGSHILEWQNKGFLPDMLIEKGYNTDQPIRERGWTHWHHLFNPRQLLVAGLVRQKISATTSFGFSQLINWNSRLCRWNIASGGGGSVQDTFYNQALNTLYDYGCRGSVLALSQLDISYRATSFNENLNLKTETNLAQSVETENDIYITDPPYGDAVKYEEITEFFIAWLRKNPPEEFAHWTWDSRRALAIKGEDEAFRQGMIAAYSKMREKMPDNGIQVLMFTHQSGTIWADMANIIWASGLQVTAAWYVVTETDSALRQGANVTGTIMLVLRKRQQEAATFRDDLGWEIEEVVKAQVEALVGLDNSVRHQSSEGLYNDADLQMAGYAAAMKVLTAYSNIDGKDMSVEAQAPRIKGKKTFVDELIDFAQMTAVQFLVPVGFEKSEWQKLQAVERFYLKMAEMEHQGAKTLDNYLNFAKAFRVHHFDQLMSESSKANAARLKLATEFKGALMSGDAEIAGTPLRALLYGLFELSKDTDVEDVLLHLMDNCQNYNQNKAILIKMADYLAEKREALKPSKTFSPDKDASAARILAEAMRNQRL
jgi:putative DNA methylase